MLRLSSAVLLCASFAGCADSSGADSSGATSGELCRAEVWVRAARTGDAAAVVGSWDGWAGPVATRRLDETWAVAQLELAPGAYGYGIVERGATRLDDLQPLSTFRGSDGLQVSWLEVADCQAPRVVAEAVRPAAGGAEIDVRLEPAESGALLDAASLTVDELAFAIVGVDTDTATVRVHGGSAGRTSITIRAQDTAGAQATPAIASVLLGRRAESAADALVYQVMVDRYRARAGDALSKPSSPGGRAGGTLWGVQAELEAGTFDALGVSTLWLSPVYTNPTEPRLGEDGNLYEGYHGYWPLASREVDPRLGGAEGLHALVDAAHARGIEVLLDLVPNHVYEANPRAAELAARGWLNDSSCVCGTASCPWDPNIQSCWFTPYLADLRFGAPEVVDTVVADAVWWQDTFDVDGVRIDAVPMMPRAVTRRIVHGLREHAGYRGGTFSVGEVFTGPGPAGTEAIRYFLGPDGLDSAFDFPLMWALRDALSDGELGFIGVEQSLNYTRDALAGSTSVPARMIGNHDVSRFISELGGDGNADVWAAEGATQPGGGELYARQTVALGLVLTLPGIPVIYYGDEVGLAGAADPDNRRVMPRDDQLTKAQVDMRAVVRRLGRLRSCLPSLRRGERTALAVSTEVLGFVRDAGDGAPTVVVARRTGAEDRVVLGGAAPQGRFVDVVTAEVFELEPGAWVPLGPDSIRVLAPATHPCVS